MIFFLNYFPFILTNYGKFSGNNWFLSLSSVDSFINSYSYRAFYNDNILFFKLHLFSSSYFISIKVSYPFYSMISIEV